MREKSRTESVKEMYACIIDWAEVSMQITNWTKDGSQGCLGSRNWRPTEACLDS